MSIDKRLLSVFGASVVFAAGAWVSVGPAQAAGQCAAGTPVYSDFDGDGKADLLIRAAAMTPGEASASTQYEVRPGDGGAATVIKPVVPSIGYVVADLDGNACSDLVFWGRGWDEVGMVLGSATGLDVTTESSFLVNNGEYGATDVDAVSVMRYEGVTQIAVVADNGEADESDAAAYVNIYQYDAAHPTAPGLVKHFNLSDFGSTYETDAGLSVAADDGVVAVGRPLDPTKGVWAGAVYIFSAKPGDPNSIAFRKRLTQNSSGIPGINEKEEFFGAEVALRDGYLAISNPHETIDKAKLVGTVTPVKWDRASNTYKAYRLISQGTPGVPGANEPGDYFGDSLWITRGLTAANSYDIAIGAPGETVGSKNAAGAVVVANFSKSIYRGYTESTRGVPGAAEKGDQFGGWVTSLPAEDGAERLVIGSPGEVTTNCDVTGAVVLSSPGRLTSATTWADIAPPCGSGLSAWATGP